MVGRLFIMEEKSRIERRRTGKKKKPFFKRRIKFLNLRYLEITIFVVFYIIFTIGIFHRVILNYFNSFVE